jgi:hypothetical protein
MALMPNVVRGGGCGACVRNECLMAFAVIVEGKNKCEIDDNNNDENRKLILI